MTPRGFTLLETLLALLIFSLAVVALVEAVNQLGRDTLHSRREADVHERMRTLLIEHTRLPDPPEETTIQEDEMIYTVRRVPLELRNRDGLPLGDLFEVRVTAEWIEGREAQAGSTETWIHPPLFQP